MTEEEKKLMEEQELKLKEKTGGTLPSNTKQKKFLLKKDRQYFDSADYVISGKQDSGSQKTIPKTVQKGELLHASTRKLSPRNVENHDENVNEEAN